VVASVQPGDIVTLRISRGKKQVRYTVQLTSPKFAVVNQPRSSSQLPISGRTDDYGSSTASEGKDYVRNLEMQIQMLRDNITDQLDQLNALEEEMKRIRRER